ncbi:MAG: hypothetical protein Q9195_008888 [Heterodermia aff. obscurata]
MSLVLRDATGRNGQSQLVNGSANHSAGDSSRAYNPPPTSFSSPKQQSFGDRGPNGLADFFSNEVFQIVLHNPTTAHRLAKFSQARMCGENMEFLEKVDRYNALLDELTTIMTDIHHSYTSTEASKQLGVSTGLLKRINADIKASTTSTLPSMESIFAEAQEGVENILRTAVKADNPIVFASDGFVSVTGYSRSEVVPRNCRFLQGNYTDRNATRRLKASIDAREETVELLLNYKKNGEPFWNLLYVAPLLDVNGRLAFFIGGQINCSTTIRSNTDVLRILSLSDDPDEDVETQKSVHDIKPTKRSFFGFVKKDNTPQMPTSTKRVEVREAGMEQGLLKQIEKMNFRTQMEAFYTAYSKYLVIKYSDFTIQFYSLGIVEVLGINNKDSQDFVGNNVFKFLAQYTTSLPREFKSKVKEALKTGQAISASISLFTLKSLARRGDDKFFTHWTPTKDEHGVVKYVVVTLSSSIYQ